MKEINKIFIKIVFFVVICMSFFSCKTDSFVTFESELFRAYRDGNVSLDEFSENFYFTRILTTICVDIVILRFSKYNEFRDIVLDNIEIEDDNGEKIFEAGKTSLKCHEGTENLNNCNYKVYYWEIPQNEFDRIVLKNYKTKYVILRFKIDGIEYTEKLKRIEKKYFITRT